MNKIKYIKTIFFFFISTTTFSQLSPDGNILPDSMFDKALRQGELSKLLNEVPNRTDLQLERLSAYFFHQRINQYRLENKLTTLYWDDRMWLAARNHNLVMTTTPSIAHIESKKLKFFSGINPWDRIQYVTYNGFSVKTYGENCLMNYSTDSVQSLVDNAKSIADRSFEQWKHSPPHNLNMLKSDFFAHGTSFVVVKDGKVYGTTNFGNASDFVKNEITISWDADVAKQFPQLPEENRKPFKPAEWSKESSRKEILNVIKTQMPKSKSAYNNDFELAATLGIESIANKETVDKFHTKRHYYKAAKKPKFKILFVKMHEKKFLFHLSIDEIKTKSALGLVDERLQNELPSLNKIENWGGKCTLAEKDTFFVCKIDLIYVTLKK